MDKYEVSKIDGKTYCRINGKFTKHLRDNGLTYQEYYETYITGKKEQCPYCNSTKTFYQHNNTYPETCGKRKCVGLETSKTKQNFSKEKNDRINLLRKQTVIEKYGVEYITQSEEFVVNVKKTRSEIMYDGRTREEHIQEAARHGKFLKYGDAYYNNNEQISKSKQARTVEQNNITNEKRKITNLEKYGVENPFNLYSSKSAKGNAKLKDYRLPDGNIIKIQGFENRALDYLFDTYNTEHIMASDASCMASCGMPVIKYTKSTGKTGTYYPDILIKSENKIIEVKSRWWFDGNGNLKYKHRLDDNYAKRNACISLGYKFEFWVYETNGTRTIVK